MVRTRKLVYKLIKAGVNPVGISEIYRGYRREIVERDGVDTVRYVRIRIDGTEDDEYFEDSIYDFGYGVASSVYLEGNLRSIVGGKAKLVIVAETSE